MPPVPATRATASMAASLYSSYPVIPSSPLSPLNATKPLTSPPAVADKGKAVEGTAAPALVKLPPGTRRRTAASLEWYG